MNSSNVVSHKSKYFEEPFQTSGDAHEPHNIVKEHKIGFVSNKSVIKQSRELVRNKGDRVPFAVCSL